MEDRYCDGCGNHIEKDGCVCDYDYQVVAKSELRKLVVEMRTKTSGIVPSGVWANKLEKILDGGE